MDNLAPEPPANLTASVVEDAIELNWEKSIEPDFSAYIIYNVSGQTLIIPQLQSMSLS